VGGFYDGEGCISIRPAGGFSISLAQVRNGLIDQLSKTLKGDGFAVGRWNQTEKRDNQQDTERTSIHGGWNECVRFLGMYRPERLLEKFQRLFRGRGPHMRKSGLARVVSVEPVGMKEVVVLETSTRTYVAEGFGHHNCVWGIWSRKSKRFIVARELLGYNIDTYQFCDLVKYLSGQISLEALAGHTRALQMLDELKFNRAYYDETKQHVFPWFEGQHKWLDFAGNEGPIGARGLVRKGEAQTAAQILGLADVILYSRQIFHSKRTEVINGLSRARADGWPGLLLDPACSLLWTGLTTGLVYKKATSDNPDPSEVAPHAIYSHLYDALGYAVCNMVELEDAEGLRMTVGPDGHLVMPAGPDLQMASYLVGA